VILAAPLAKRLREHRLASRYKQPSDFVFANMLGRDLDYRDVGEGFRQAVTRAELHAPGKLTLHSLRHGFASLLIARRLDVVFVRRQLGHANPSITLEVYAHLYERADHAETAPDAIEASYAAMASGNGILS
jgi:integrase